MLENKFLSDASHQMIKQYRSEGSVTWECPSNIALIKYWGKKGMHSPINPSLSFTLSKCKTRMTVEYSISKKHNFSLQFLHDDKPNPLFEDRLKRYLETISVYLPVIKNMRLLIKSSNSFPHSSGIASSASAYGALALTLCSIEQQDQGNPEIDKSLYGKASFLARLGSGSACRSIYGGTVLWGKTTRVPDSTDEAALPVSSLVHPVFHDFKDAVLVISSAPKSITSSNGHLLMKKHPYASGRVFQANNNLAEILKVMQNGDIMEFTRIVENEALSLHALMLSSQPGYLLMKPETMAIIQEVRTFREETGAPLAFTLDAGPNVHLLYPASQQTRINTFIRKTLTRYCEDGRIIYDQVGNGPSKL